MREPAPIACARALRHRPGFAFLDASDASPDALSILATDPELVIRGAGDDWAVLERELARRRRATPDLGLPSGAAIGWLEFGGEFCFGFYPQVSVFSHASGKWTGAVPPEGGGRPATGLMPRFEPVWGESDYVRAVSRAKDYIAAGDIYQVCIAHPFRAAFDGDLFPFFERLRVVSPAPFAAFLELDGRQVASASPELFLQMSGREIVTRPIKGTRRRHPNPDLDERAAFELVTSAKELAELVMITDLERNDLGKICEYGSVSVPRLPAIESFAQVHHLVATVRGTLRAEISHAAALRSCSPGGSISGAPKKRALEIIAELEPWPRGLYTGAIGYLGFNGESRFSMAIRTACARDGLAEFFVGAGIVADSVPLGEWVETLDKASGLLAAAAPGPALRLPGERADVVGGRG